MRPIDIQYIRIWFVVEIREVDFFTFYAIEDFSERFFSI